MSESVLHDASLRSLLEAALERPDLRRPSGELDLCASLAWLHAAVGPLHETSAAAPLEVATAIATAAWLDLGLAFSLWSHRMVLEYCAASDRPRPELEPLQRAALVGSSALASGMAHHVGGAPLPLTAWRAPGGLVIDGRVRWASNLFERGFLLVTAVNRDGEGPCIVAVPATAQGLTVDPYPSLLALQQTQSSSLRLRAVEVPESAVLSLDFERFIRRVRPRFLLLQSSFCWGLAARSLHEASLLVQGTSEVFADEHRALGAELARLTVALEAGLSNIASNPEPPIRDLVRLRLDIARLAGHATLLESKLSGGAGYVTTSASARRLLEAAFLPVQSPTEGQLLWELSRSS